MASKTPNRIGKYQGVTTPNAALEKRSTIISNKMSIASPENQRSDHNGAYGEGGEKKPSLKK